MSFTAHTHTSHVRTHVRCTYTQDIRTHTCTHTHTQSLSLPFCSLVGKTLDKISAIRTEMADNEKKGMFVCSVVRA